MAIKSSLRILLANQIYMGEQKNVIMKKLAVSVIIIGILLWRCADGCLDYERNALMELMDSFHVPRYGMVGDDDCCQWDAVECSSSTGRVTELHVYRHDMDPSEYYYFNASLFLPFHQLNTLSIGLINIAGCVHNQCFERLSQLKKLESLYFFWNTFKNRSILSSIASISSLRSLRLYDIGLEGTDEIQWLSKLEKLEELDLTGNNFNNIKLLSLPVISSLKKLYLYGCGLKETVDIQGLSKLEKLEILGLSGNKFNNTKQLSLPASLKTLYLAECGLKGTVDIQEFIGNGTSLKNLSLAWNEIESFGGGGAAFKNFSNLELLDLSDNSLDNSILSSINQCFSLKYLHVDHNKLQGSINLEELDALANLEVLELSGNQIDRIVASRGININGNLRALYLNNNAFNGKSNVLLHLLEAYPRLKTISLGYNQLEGSILVQGLCKLGYLEELDISYNEFSGTLPWCIANLTSLKKLDLSWNHFNGSIFPLRSLTSLQELRFSSNQFQVPISLNPFFNHSKLKYLDASNNSQIYNDEEIDVHNLSPKFQLEVLLMSSRGNGGAFPKFLHHQHDLQKVDLSNIKLKGEFPYWLLVNNTKLSNLYLANTSLSGPFQLPNDSPMYLLRYFDISDNYLNSTIPTNIGQILPSLSNLNLSNNIFMGSIPSTFGNMSDLGSLDMSYNWLSGKVPEDLYIGCSSLDEVILSHNDFEGQIFSKYANCNNLRQLVFDWNQFSGDIPNSLLNCTGLSILYASNNHLSGNIPGWISNMSYLEVLDLSTNNFSKSLPSHLCPYAIKEFYLSNNQLQGLLGNVFYNCSGLTTLDLSHNHLTGAIPRWIGKLNHLSYILLSYNNLQGSLPIELCNLGQLSLVDLSNNNLSGRVLSCIRCTGKYMQRGVISNSDYAQPPRSMQQSVEFTTKRITYEYHGIILKLISGIDFSCNNFTGEIPIELGNLSIIKVLNLSHNSLTGPIPQSFANLKEIESLDLSYNNLNGKIPPQLTQLNFVSDFSVAHNNLSGKIPEMVGQFATFEKSSYEGNPLLCGVPLLKSCQTEDSSKNLVEEKESGFIDMTDFYISFSISYVIVLLSIGAVLCINPYWRRAWFYLIEISLRNCYYFIEDIIFALRKLRACRSLFI